jgi:uncharacterized membrane protein YedE/YeeE
MSDGAWVQGLREDFQQILVEPWSPYIGAILMVLVVLGLMMAGLFWGIFGGMKLFGDWFNNLIGLGPLLGIKPDLDTPLMHRMALMNMTLVLGAFVAAMISRQFGIHRPPPLEYVWAALGGTAMGLGATLAGGCTTGGFFTPLVHASPAGWAMWLGLLVGAAIGLKALLWTLENIAWGMTAPKPLPLSAPIQRAMPWLALVLLGWLLVWTVNWYDSPDEKLRARAILIPAGFALGFIMHRSRLCFARAFREPFMTAETEMTKAIIIALVVAMPLAALLFAAKVIDPYLGIPPTFWLGSLSGGLIFGVGMVFAGGCASGSLWRMGEGHLKLWVAGFFFAWGGSVSSALLKHSGLMVTDINIDGLEFTALGTQAYWPDLLGGWGWSLAISFAILAIWYLWLRYNESTERFTLL